jgi:voltage-gated potassium channel
MNNTSRKHSRKEKLFQLVFKTNTKASKTFDLFLIAAIMLNIIIVMLDSVDSIWTEHEHLLSIIEWVFTLLFTVEYILRLAIVQKPLKFAFSFYGIIDLLSCLPAYLALFATAGSGLIIIRALRLLRLFRVLKLTRYVNAGTLIADALKASRYKIGVFLYTVVMIIIVIGALMYFIEGKASGFDSIPRSMYWVVVTITTVGYGDIAPMTTIGQFIASIVMIMGYAIIAVPTGIVSAETARLKNRKTIKGKCPRCAAPITSEEVNYCTVCGEKLH